jgi:hypothetical protein
MIGFVAFVVFTVCVVWALNGLFKALRDADD